MSFELWLKGKYQTVMTWYKINDEHAINPKIKILNESSTL